MKRILTIIPYGKTTSEDLFNKMWSSVRNAIKQTKNIVRVLIVTPENITVEGAEIIKAPKNVGAGEARNLGLDYLETIKNEVDCFTFIDADDLISPNYFSVPNTNWDICQTKRCLLLRESVQRHNVYVLSHLKDSKDRSEYLLRKAREGIFGEQCWSRFYDIKYSGVRMPNYGIWEDSVYFIKIMEAHPNIKIHNANYFWRRDNSNSMTKGKSIDKRNLISSLNNLKFLEVDKILNGVNPKTQIDVRLRGIERNSGLKLRNIYKSLEIFDDNILKEENNVSNYFKM